ncbi:hypothetical protein Tco_1486939 [Tanacetum coccineum]
MIRFRLLERNKLVLNLLKKGLLVRVEAMEASKRRRRMLDYRIQQLFKGSSEGSDFYSDEENKDEENKDEENKVDAEVAKKQAGNEQLVYSLVKRQHQHPHHQPHKLKFKCVRPLAQKTNSEKLRSTSWWQENRDGQTTGAKDSMTRSYLV